jgi:hypothetical protein
LLASFIESSIKLLVFVSTSSLTVACFGAACDFVPGSFPLFAPREGSFANNANFFWQILFLHFLLGSFVIITSPPLQASGRMEWLGESGSKGLESAALEKCSLQVVDGPMRK